MNLICLPEARYDILEHFNVAILNLNLNFFILQLNTWLRIGHKVILLVGWRTNMKHIWLGKTIKMSFLAEKPNPTHAAVGYEPATSQSLSGCFHI